MTLLNDLIDAMESDRVRDVLGFALTVVWFAIAIALATVIVVLTLRQMAVIP